MNIPACISINDKRFGSNSIHFNLRAPHLHSPGTVEYRHIMREATSSDSMRGTVAEGGGGGGSNARFAVEQVPSTIRSPVSGCER